MSRLDEIKSEVARDNGYESWEDAAQYLTGSNYNVASIEDYGMVDEVARRYASEVAQHALNKAAERATIRIVQNSASNGVDEIIADKQSITDPSNIDLI